ncbi:MAG: site-2 protease family protein [Candidatus Omnitrophica bacterium]|nr:site-2 protease family protein [Candidatus Omnitrophota bacterium]
MNIIGLLISFGLLIIAMTTHEFAHGWVANRLGDPTAKYSGRLTLNPLAHIDLFWTIILPFFLYITTQGQFVFGAAKPVPINYWSLRNPKRDIIWVGLSGPLANFIFAFALSLFMRFLPLPDLIYFVFQNLVIINIILGVFNLVPIPPLDGSRILGGLLPDRLSYRLSMLEPYGFIIVILLIWMGLFDFLIWPIVKVISVLLLGH